MHKLINTQEVPNVHKWPHDQSNVERNLSPPFSSSYELHSFVLSIIVVFHPVVDKLYAMIPPKNLSTASPHPKKEVILFEGKGKRSIK